MTEDAVTKFLERVNRDEGFREKAQRDPATALAEFDLRAAEQVARATHDEDAFRRLASTVEQEAAFWSGVKRFFSRIFCGPGRTRNFECKKEPSSPT